jgi:hypothetical protein
LTRHSQYLTVAAILTAEGSCVPAEVAVERPHAAVERRDELYDVGFGSSYGGLVSQRIRS